MKLRRLKKIKINCWEFNITWNSKHNGGSFSYLPNKIEIGTLNMTEEGIFMVLCHEIMEIITVEMSVRLRRPDCDTDYLFNYDHRQHETMMNMFAGVLSQFIR